MHVCVWLKQSSLYVAVWLQQVISVQWIYFWLDKLNPFLNSSWNYFDGLWLSVAVCLLAILKIMDNLHWKHFKELRLVDLINFWIRSQNPSSRIFYAIGGGGFVCFLPMWQSKNGNLASHCQQIYITLTQEKISGEIVFPLSKIMWSIYASGCRDSVLVHIVLQDWESYNVLVLNVIRCVGHLYDRCCHVFLLLFICLFSFLYICRSPCTLAIKLQNYYNF